MSQIFRIYNSRGSEVFGAIDPDADFHIQMESGDFMVVKGSRIKRVAVESSNVWDGDRSSKKFQFVVV